MARTDTYLVAVDFSRGSEKALDFALTQARKTDAAVVALHVVPDELIGPPTGAAFDFYESMKSDAEDNFRRLAERKNLKPEDWRFLVTRGVDVSEAIVQQAKELQATLIIMGSHGRTGLRRLVLGSVAEKTVRHADRPVLIVK